MNLPTVKIQAASIKYLHSLMHAKIMQKYHTNLLYNNKTQ